MQLRELRAFCEVVAEMSFTRAARNLHYAQSSVTAQIRSLEDDLGVPLFDRGGRRIVLTKAGLSLLPYAEQMLRIADAAYAEVAATAARQPARRSAA
ncbi:LysR family transcriptional regulator [Kitasatospora sp. MAP5-34]|uniref:LysR family transcriptional regulator n=1 Tax=Kitasatospora sp. MAP5-34 TaxID=3035102 RepID=UPI002474D60C|nr:LysR family transcriptional regulator [Kitasatospora sp. MAP5-34]MDH6577486.1 DNA-binding transcriptional LysR family regulator [Kitasatospora sp. MAP5-34]